jgi:catechol 2,3-dioxygenase
MKPRIVRLNVRDPNRARLFYERTIGLRELESDREIVRMGAGDDPLVELVASAGAPARPPGTTGLFHLAILVATRRDLAISLGRVSRSGWPLTGVADHLVSESLYLDDPEGNGIELYRDRPRADWPRADGRIQMATLPLDLETLSAELGDADAATDPGMPAGTRIGHVHLNVADLDRAESFYCDLLGFEVTVRTFPGALFVATAGYHHDLGLNTWSSLNGPPPPPGALGMSSSELVVEDPSELDRVQGRLAEAGVESRPADGGIRVADPFGNGVRLRAR